MNEFTTIEKLTFLQKRVDLTLSNGNTDGGMNKQQAAADLLIKAVMLGASGNCLKQVCENKLTDADFEAIKLARRKVADAYSELAAVLKSKTDTLIVKNHKFH